MKTFMQKLQEAGKKAAEINKAIHGAPAKAAELREAVAMTAGELHQLRTDVQSNLGGLRAHNDQHLLDAMGEINDGSETLAEAGYELTGMDLDLALNQRLSVELDQVLEVSQHTLDLLLAKESRPMIKAILTGIIKAEETAETVELSHLSYQGLIIHIGSTPAIRMCWRRVGVNKEAQPAEAAHSSFSPPPVPSTTVGAATPSVFGSYFDHRPVPGSTLKTPEPTPPPGHSAAGTDATETHSPTYSSSAKASAESGGWSGQALDRFKKMPDLSKRAR